MSHSHRTRAARALAGLFLLPSLAAAQAVIHEQASIHESSGAFGDPVRLQGSTLLVGAPRADGAGAESGELVLFDLGPPLGVRLSLIGSDLAAGDHFGGTAAIDGDVIVVGADRHAHGTNMAGAAYVFRFLGGSWSQEAELLASDRAAGDNFGSGVGISGDTIVVGAPGSDAAGVDRGAVYVFERSAGTWTEVYRGLSSVSSTRRMGWRVAIDGDRVLAAAPDSGLGEVHAFVRTASGWSTDTIFAAPPASPYGTFGTSCDVEGDLVAVGMPYGDVTGAVFLYRAASGSWTQEALLHGIYDGALFQFGSGVDLQGERLLVSARGASTWDQFCGAGYVFEHAGGAWRESLKLLPSDGAQYDFVGMAVAFDGQRAVLAGADPANRVDLFALTDLVGTPFCAGDGSGGPCPCGNTSTPGLGLGCANSYGWGAALAATGSNSISADDLSISVAHAVHTTGFPPIGVPVLLIAGTGQVGGGLGVFAGDGLHCVNTNVLRLGVRFTTPYGGLAIWPPGLGAIAGVGAGDTRYFEAWYRDPDASPCGAHFNTTNALEITFAP